MTFGRTMICPIAWLRRWQPPRSPSRRSPRWRRAIRRPAATGRAAPRSTEWFFTRNGNRVEIGRGDYVELWERDQRGQVSWRRIFHADRKVIAYSPGQLRALERELPRETLNTVYDAKHLLGNLKRVEETRWLTRRPLRRKGRQPGGRGGVARDGATTRPHRAARSAAHLFQLTLQSCARRRRRRGRAAIFAPAADYRGDRRRRPRRPRVRPLRAEGARDGRHSHGHAH